MDHIEINQIHTDIKPQIKTKRGSKYVLTPSQRTIFLQKILPIIVKQLRKLIELAPKNSSEVYSDILDSYQDLMLDITTKLDKKTILEHKQDIIKLFEAIWRYIALFNFKHDLNEYYSKDILDIHFKLDISQQENEIIELGTDLQLLISEEEPTDTLHKKLDDALSQIQLLTPEARKEQENKMKKLKKELGEEKYKEYLLKEFGLK